MQSRCCERSPTDNTSHSPNTRQSEELSVAGRMVRRAGYNAEERPLGCPHGMFFGCGERSNSRVGL